MVFVIEQISGIGSAPPGVTLALGMGTRGYQLFGAQIRTRLEVTASARAAGDGTRSWGRRNELPPQRRSSTYVDVRSRRSPV